MSIRIDRERCVGCGKCAGICPGSLFGRDSDGKSVLRYPRDCWGCTSCLKDCPWGAISLYLGADIGGMGGELTVRQDGHKLVWSVRRGGRVEREIEIDPRVSNQY